MSRGLTGSLEAVFRPGEGKTRAEVSAGAPLELRGPFLREKRPDLYYLRNVTSGIFAGDTYDVSVRAMPGAQVQVASSSSTKAYCMEGGARSRVCIEAEADASVVWGPQPLILQDGADLTQETTVLLKGGSVLLADIIVMGRLARGEQYRFRRFASNLAVVRADGCVLYEERYALQPGEDGSLPDAMGGYGVLASVYALGVEPSGALSSMQNFVSGFKGLAGASLLPNGAGSAARLLCASLSQAQTFCEALLTLEQSGAGSTS